MNAQDTTRELRARGLRRYGFWMDSGDCGVVWTYSVCAARRYAEQNPETYWGNVARVVLLKVQSKLKNDKLYM